MRILIGALAVALLVGCAPVPISADKADPVSPDRVFAYSAKAESQIVVTRDAGMSGSGCTIRFYIDGKPAADFHAGEVARFGVAAGKHILAVEGVRMCAGTGLAETEINLKPGESLRRRIAGISLTPTSF
jgi:hypothetical protein